MPVNDAPQTNKQHAVPQNVMDVEFKLIGDLTMRQFAYLLLGGILAYVTYMSVSGIFKIPFTILFALIGLALAFGSYQDRGMDVWISNFVTAVNQPTQRVWKKQPEIPQAFLQDRIDMVKRELITLAPTSSRRKLEKYLEYGISDEEIDPLDIPEAEYVMKVRAAFAEYDSYETTASVTPNSSVEVDVIAPPPLSPPVQQPKVFTPVPQKEKDSGSSVKEDKQKPSPIYKPKEDIKPQDTKEEYKKEKRSDQKTKHVKQKQLQMPSRPKSKNSGHYVPLEAITPDRHSGRRFSRILPSDGEIILPIRGEKVLQTTFEQNVERELQEKADQLQELLGQIKVDATGNVSVTPVEKKKNKIPEKEKPSVQKTQAPPKPKVSSTPAQPEEVVKEVKIENKRIRKRIENIKNELSKIKKAPGDATQKNSKTRMLEEKLKRSNAEYETLQRQLNELQTRLSETEKFDDEKKPIPASFVRASSAKVGRVFTQAPNTLSGQIKDSKGGILPGVLILVKDSKGDPVRAFKTNKLGEFLLSTPLDNGMYTIEVSESNNLEQTFDIISVEVRGEVIPPISLVGV